MVQTLSSLTPATKCAALSNRMHVTCALVCWAVAGILYVWSSQLMDKCTHENGSVKHLQIQAQR